MIYNGQNKKYKHDLQNISQKTKNPIKNPIKNRCWTQVLQKGYPPVAPIMKLSFVDNCAEISLIII